MRARALAKVADIKPDVYAGRRIRCLLIVRSVSLATGAKGTSFILCILSDFSSSPKGGTHLTDPIALVVRHSELIDMW